VNSFKGKYKDRPVFDFFLARKLICIRNGKIYASLKAKIVLFTVLAIIVIESSTFYLLEYISRVETASALNRTSVSFISVTAADIKYALEYNDFELLNNTLDAIRYNESISYGIIYDSQGEMLASYGRIEPKLLDELPKRIQDLSHDMVTFQNPENQTMYSIMYPVIKVEVDTLGVDMSDPVLDPQKLQTYNRRLGVFVYGISSNTLSTYLGSWRDQAVLITFWFILLFSTIAYFLVQKIIDPTRQLLDATLKVSSGDLKVQIPTLSNDELGMLGDSFNQMVERLEQSQKELEAYTTELETRVEQRTRELSLSEEKYRTLFEYAGNALVLVNKQGSLVMANKMFHETVNITTQESENKKIYEFFNIDDADVIKNIINDVEKYGPSRTFETRLYYDSSVRIVNVIITNLPKSDVYMISLIDVTEFKEMQNRLVRSEHLVEIGELSASVAHEIRNPLGAINTSIGILQSMLDLQDDEAELMKIITEEAQHLDMIISNFLHFAHLNESAIQNISVGDLILSASSDIAKQYDVPISTDIKDSPHLKVDPEQLLRALKIIMLNAAESITNGNGTIAIESVSSLDDYNQPYLFIKVRDNGEGIEDIHVDKIFKPFYSTKVRQSGMGLAICDRIIQNHGGEIYVKSTRGLGSEFTVALPLNRK